MQLPMTPSKSTVIDALSSITHLGPQRATLCYDMLGLRSVDDVIQAARAHTLQQIPGIGALTEAKILQAALAMSPPPVAPVAEMEPAAVAPPAAAQPTGPSTLTDLLICPNCGHGQFKVEPGQIECLACRSEYARDQGMLRLTQPYSTGGWAQWVMTTTLYTTLYESFMRPRLTQMVTTRTMEEEYALAATLLELSPASRLLDVACGTGNFTRFFARRIDASLGPGDSPERLGPVVGLDISEPMLEMASFYAAQESLHQRVAFVLADAARMPFRQGAFDRLHCAGALYLMEDVAEVLRNFAYVLEPGGVCVVTTYVPGQGRFRRWVTRVSGAAAGFRWFDDAELRRLCRQAGLEVLHADRQDGALTLKARRV